MNRLSLIVLLSCLIALLAGCAHEPPIWETVKITDLVPPANTKNPDGPLLKKANFKVYIFDIPAEKADVLNDIWPMLSTRPLGFNDDKAFAANLFSAGLGRVADWGRIARTLRAAGAKQAMTISMMLPQGLANDLTIAEFPQEQTIFYTTADGSAEGLTVNSGALVLRINAEPVPGSRGLCRVGAKPLYTPLIRTAVRQLAEKARAGEVPFDFAGLELKMGPDDFIFLGPKKFINNRITLGGLFFKKPDKPVLRTYLIVCTSVNY